ncbi:MAG: hypothetical protein U1F71_12505 [Verrucomicrobiaceae bacterium]
MARWGYAFFDSGVRWDSPDAHPTTMRDLDTFFVNPFDDRDISIDELLAFTTDHLERMTANNGGGELSARITATTTALDQVSDCVSDDQGKLGLRKARKQAKDNFRETLPLAVAKIMSAVAYYYGPDAPQITECVPQGRTIFSTCRDDKVETHLQTLVTALTSYQGSIEDEVITDATNLKNAWVAVYNASESATGAKTSTEQGKQLARENLQLMLFLNLLKLAEMFPRQPEKLSLYMQQSLLENPSSPPEPEPPPPGP